MVVAKAAAMEATKHYNSSMVGSRQPVEVAPYRRRSWDRWMLGWALRGGGAMEHHRRCRCRWTWPR